MADENVQPDPCVFGLRTCSPPNVSTSVPSQSTSIGLSMWPPVTITARAPICSSFCPAAFIPARSFTSRPVRNSASGIFGVITLARFRSSSRTYFRPCGSSKSSFPAVGRNRIEHHVRKFVFVEKFSNGGCVRAVRKHSNFHPSDHYVFGQGIELRAQRGSRSGMHGTHTLRGLNRKSRDRGNAVAIVRRESFQVSSDTGSTGRIKSCNC